MRFPSKTNNLISMKSISKITRIKYCPPHDDKDFSFSTSLPKDKHNSYTTWQIFNNLFQKNEPYFTNNNEIYMHKKLLYV